MKKRSKHLIALAIVIGMSCLSCAVPIPLMIPIVNDASPEEIEGTANPILV